MDPRDYISSYEGREEPAEEKPRCQACGKEVDQVSRCVWDTDLLVGPCCEVYIDHQCPDCGSDHLNWQEYDLGRDSETGYHDAGIYVVCSDCGAKNDERDTEVKIGPMHAIQPALFPELEKKPAKMERPAIDREVRRG
jgi:hypothetical protein